MTLTQLEIFRTLARTEHLTRTAAELNYSVPALSMRLSRLEEELGTPLFDRGGGRLRLNRKGQQYLGYVEQALDILEEGRAALAEADAESGTVYVGTLEQRMWLGCFRDFLALHPDIFISRAVLTADRLDAAGLRGLDLLLCDDYVFSSPEWEAVPLFENDAPVAVLSPGHPLSGRAYLTAADLADENVILLPQSSPVRRYFDELCAREHVRLSRLHECDTGVREEIIRSGGRYAALSFSRSLPLSGMLEGLERIPLRTGMPTRRMCLYLRRGKALPPEAETLRGFITEYFAK